MPLADLEQKVTETINEKGLNQNSLQTRKIVTAAIMYQEGFSYDEIAKNLGLGNGTAVTYVYEAEKLELRDANLDRADREKEKQEKLEERVAAIKAMLDSWTRDRGKIARVLGLSEKYVSVLISKRIPEYKRCKRQHERVKELQAIVRPGIVSAKEIAQATGLSENYARYYLKTYFKIPPLPSAIISLNRANKDLVNKALNIMNEKVLDPYNKKDLSIVLGRLMYDSGHQYNDIRRITGEGHVTNLLQVGYELGIFEKPQIRQDLKILPRYERLYQIKWLIDQENIKTPEEISDRLGISKKHASNLIKFLPPHYKKHIQRPFQEPANQERNRIIDALAEEGKSSPEIGEAVNLSARGARSYLVRHGKYPQWKQKRVELAREPKIKKQLYNDLAGLVKARVMELAADKGWEYQKAIEYYLSRPRNHPKKIPLENLIKLFSTYRKARDEGIKLSCEDMAKRSGIKWGHDVSRILKGAGEHPFIERKPLVNYQKEAIRRAYNLMSRSDIAYFVRVPKNIVVNDAKFWKLKRSKYLRGVDTEYRFISQIYEAKDAGYSFGEILELLRGKNSRGNPRYSKDDLKMILDNREELQGILIDKLRAIFPDKKIKKPYLTS